AFNPSVAFYISYQSADGDAAILHPGAKLTTAGAGAPFEMSVENIENATNVTASTRYIVYMIGPDVPSRSSPTARNVRHYLAGNLTVSSQNSSVLARASLLSNSSAATNEYVAPAPSARTGSHRYVYLLYTQPPALNSKSFASLGFNSSARTRFNLTAFRSLAGLGPSIGGTFFEIDTDANSTSGGSTSGTGTG
ncbi:phosphatidylethanolamine-binding protein, partial [Rhexocercosporidium sp. MPI-PUGE-AT-0058]